jgi:hypothetical protein
MSRVIARPRDVCRGMDPVVVCWVKRRWACEEEQCPPADVHRVGAPSPATVPDHDPAAGAGRRRARRSGDRLGRGGPGTPACSGRWPTKRSAAAADPVLDKPHAPVTHLGVDEHRRSRPQWEINPKTGPARPISAPSGSASPDCASDPPRQAVHRRAASHAPVSPPKQPTDPRRSRGDDTM